MEGGDTRKMITVVFRIKAKAGQEDEYIEAFRPVLRFPKDEGCINHTLFRSQTDPCKFIFFEQFVDLNARNLHRSREGEMLGIPPEKGIMRTAFSQYFEELEIVIVYASDRAIVAKEGKPDYYDVVE